MDLSKLGIWTTYHHIGEEHAGEAAQLVEQLGYGTFWLGGSPRLSTVRALLQASERLVVATGIVNVWQYEPGDLAREHAELSSDFPDRLLLGIGVGHPEATSEYQRTAEQDDLVPRRPRRGAAAGAARAALSGGARAEDAAAQRRALGRRDPVLHARRAHALRARAARCGAAAGAGARVRDRRRRRARASDGARLREALPRAEQLHRATCCASTSTSRTSPTAALTG